MNPGVVSLADLMETGGHNKRGEPDFATLCRSHSSLLGITLSVKLRVVQAFNLKKTITLFTNTNEMTGQP